MTQKLMDVCDVPVKSGSKIEAHGVPAVMGIEVTIDGKTERVDVCAQHAGFARTQLAAIGVTAPFEKAPASRSTNGHTRRSGPAKKAAAKKTAAKKATAKKKAPRQLTAKSGAKFTTADARDWLVKEGHMGEAQSGRIGNDLLDLYAAAH